MSLSNKRKDLMSRAEKFMRKHTRAFDGLEQDDKEIQTLRY